MKKKTRKYSEKEARKDVLSIFFHKRACNTFDFDRPSATYRSSLTDDVHGYDAEVTFCYNIKLYKH